MKLFRGVPLETKTGTFEATRHSSVCSFRSEHYAQFELSVENRVVDFSSANDLVGHIYVVYRLDSCHVWEDIGYRVGF